MNNNDFEVIHIIETFYGFSFFEINIIIFCRLWTHCGQNEQDQWQSQAHRLQYTKSKRGSETEHSGALWWMNAMDVTESSRLASVGNEIRQKQWHVGVQQVWDHGAFHRLLNWKYRTWHSLNVALGFRRSLIFCSSRLKHQISPAEKFFWGFFFLANLLSYRPDLLDPIVTSRCGRRDRVKPLWDLTSPEFSGIMTTLGQRYSSDNRPPSPLLPCKYNPSSAQPCLLFQNGQTRWVGKPVGEVHFSPGGRRLIKTELPGGY